MQLQDSELLRTRAYIDGAWVVADSGETTPVINPAALAASSRFNFTRSAR